MSKREEFLNKFELISKSCAENICIYCRSDLKNSLGVTYVELNRLSCNLSEYFLTVFGNHPQYIGVSISDYCFLPCIILALWKSGKCFAGAGNQFSKKCTLHFLNFLEVRFLITDKEDISNETLISSFHIYNQTYFVLNREHSSKNVNNNILEDICYGIVTSGSTGEPKIVQVPWSCILPNAIELSEKFQVNEFDCIFQASPYSFDPFFIELLMTLLNGSTLLIVSNSLKLHAQSLLKVLFEDSAETSAPPAYCGNYTNYFSVEVKEVIQKKVTVLQMTPSCFKRWSHSEIQNFILSSETSLRILLLGGEKFPKEILKLKHSDNTTQIFNIYGITEISCWAFINEITDFLCNVEISLGKPLKNILYKISENREFLIGSRYRICFVDKECVSQTDQLVFRNTGDVVELINDQLYYTGRSDHIIKKFGIKINLNKIEEIFKYKCEFVKECYCVYDDVNLILGLFFEPIETRDKGSFCNILTYEDFCSRSYTIPLDELKDIEKPDYFLEIREIPLSSHGKCDRKKLLLELRNSYNLLKPNLKLESYFRMLWVKALGVKQLELFSLGFKELGGTSVLALDIINKLEDANFNVPQNFINELLGGKNFGECLKSLSVAPEKCGDSQEKFKLDISSTDVRLLPRWKFNLGKCIDATPSIFTFQGEVRIVIGSHSSQLACFNSDSGSVVWSICLGDRIESGFRPTRDGTKGFIGCYDHYVYCLSSGDGSIIWKFKTEDMIKSTPCLSSNEETLFVGSYDKHLYCLRTSDGVAKKSFKPSNGSIFCSGVVSNVLKHFYTGTLDGTCIAIHQETLNPVWKVVLKSPIFATPCLVPHKNEILFSEVLGDVHCFQAIDGVKMWTFTAGGNIYSSPIVEDSSIIFGCHDSHLYCLRYDEEVKLKWKQQLDSYIFARPAFVKEFLICAATTKGIIYLCDSTSGSPKSKLDLKAEIFSSPVYKNNKIFIGCRNNNIYSVDICKM